MRLCGVYSPHAAPRRPGRPPHKMPQRRNIDGWHGFWCGGSVADEAGMRHAATGSAPAGPVADTLRFIRHTETHARHGFRGNVAPWRQTCAVTRPLAGRPARRCGTCAHTGRKGGEGGEGGDPAAPWRAMPGMPLPSPRRPQSVAPRIARDSGRSSM